MSDVRLTSEGPRGPRGRTGPTGPTGPAGASDVAAGLFRPSALGSTVTIVSQSGEFASGQYLAVGNYIVHLNAIAGITSADQIIPIGMGAGGAPLRVSVLGAFPGAGPGEVLVNLFDQTGTPIDQDFYLHVRLL